MSSALRLLLDANRGDRNNIELSRDCGGVPTHSRIQQIGNRPMRVFPDPPTLKGLARGLNVTVEQIIAACAADLDLPMGAPDSSALVLGGARSLPESSQQLLVSLSREMMRLSDVSTSK
ncbi:hypothetical protein [Pseudarthrobacter sp. MEB009]|uniref:hypothetical protein n=1 Tax=Pseudarthrobacter sp. MEB009 TaxID=3040326 RepID=UPI00255443BF|nr:hypothetical protein [Pseudarthrobacter sp. MEB009]